MIDRRTTHMSWEDAASLVFKLKEDGNRLHLLFNTQLLLGLRISDCLSLRWEDLFSKHLTITEKKTGKSRKMIVTTQLQEAAKEEFSRIWKGNPKELIFLNKMGTQAISVSYVNKMLKKSFKKYGLESKQVSSHMLRKTFAYKVLEDNDFSEKAIFTISRILNHSTVATTMLYLNLNEREEGIIYESLEL